MTPEQPRRVRGTRRPQACLFFGIFVAFVVFGVDGFAGTAHAQSDITDADLVASSGTRTVRLGSASGASRPADIPLEVYVARVLAGEAEPRAAEGAQRALAIAIRTFAM